jgi:hypothetical protein
MGCSRAREFNRDTLNLFLLRPLICRSGCR